ncbi:MAG: hypothetical protein IJQ43_02650 [Oscillospiraceae bacterium]|nr:hypothetical protein [Oscillospiraceae bacterium]
MLGKLMKYDLRSCLRKFAPLWIAALALSVLIGLSFRYVVDIEGGSGGLVTFLLGVLPSMVLFGLFVAMAVLALIFVCERFYRGLLGDEGYLMLTLPASAGAHIASKGLTALILEIVSGLVAVLSGFLLVTVYRPAGFAEGWVEFWRALGQLKVPSGFPWLIVEGVVLFLVTAAAQTLKIYAAIALGHLAKRHRALWALLSYVGIGFALNILFGIGVSNGLVERLLGFGSSWGFFSASGEITAHGLGMAAGAIGTAIVTELVLCAAFFFLTRYILRKRLNLE